MKTKARKRKRAGDRVGEKPGGTCFVLMPFHSPFNRYYDNIFVPAILKAKLSPIKADSLFRPSPIMGDVWRLVREAKVLLADLSGTNPNVFYELGLAHAIGKPVVLVSDKIEDVPFDLRGLRVIIYDKNNENWGSELEEKILKSLKETMADAKSAVPPMFLEPQKVGRPSEDPLGQQLRAISSELRALRSERTAMSFQAYPISSQAVPPVTVHAGVRDLVPGIDGIPNQALKNIISHLLNGERVQAVKLVRDTLDLPLAACVEIADSIREAALRMTEKRV